MVSGLVTSPCDQLRIFSGTPADANGNRISHGFAISNGLEQTCSSAFRGSSRSTGGLDFSSQFPVLILRENRLELCLVRGNERMPRWPIAQNLLNVSGLSPAQSSTMRTETENRELL